MRINWFFIWTNLIPLHPRMLCAKIGLNWPSGSGEEDFLISSMYFRYFVIISSWKRTRPFIWTNLNSPSPKDALCQVWLKLIKWFWRRFLNFVNVFFLYPFYLPLEKGRALYWNKLESPLPKDALCQVWLKLAQWFWRRRWKCEKFTDRRTDGRTDRHTTDDRWSEKLTWAFSSGGLKKVKNCSLLLGEPCHFLN